MALETASYIPELNPANPVGASDPKSQGDDHIRAIKTALLGTFPNFVGTASVPKSVTATEDQLNTAVSTAGTSLQQGRTTIPVVAGAMQSATTNGAAPANNESSSNKVLYKTLDFDQTTQEFAGFVIPFPKNWNEGTVTFQPIWTASSGSGGVVWALQAVALSNDDAIDTAYGTEQTSTDTLIATGDVHVGPESSAITIAGTPAVDDLCCFRIKRNVSDGSDTLSGDAKLIAIRLYFTTNAGNDA